MPYTPPARNSSGANSPGASISPLGIGRAAGSGFLSEQTQFRYDRLAIHRTYSPPPPLHFNKTPRTQSQQQQNYRKSASGRPRRGTGVFGRQVTQVNGVPSPVDSEEDDDDASGASDESVTTIPMPRSLTNLDELKQAIRGLSPVDKTTGSPPSSPKNVPLSLPPHPHKRPSLPMLDLTRAQSYNAGHSSGSTLDEDGGDEADEWAPVTMEPPRMIRKKSGELVKSSLKLPHFRRRPVSMPTTPNYGKSVRFDHELEHVRHFLQAEQPTAVSTSTSPTEEPTPSSWFGGVDDENCYQLDRTNFRAFPDPADFDKTDMLTPLVKLETLYLSNNGKNVIGHVFVRNLAFQKLISARFTFDGWQTVSEISATYVARPPGVMKSDVFAFSIKLVDYPRLEQKQLQFCVRFRVGEEEFWDNNSGKNYVVEFKRRPVFLARRATHPADNSPPRIVAQNPADVMDSDLNRTSFASFLASQIESPKSTLLQDLGEGESSKSSNSFNYRGSVSERPKPHRLPVRQDSLDPEFPKKRAIPTSSSAFLNRYDFGASLNAAIAAANGALGSKSGIEPRTTDVISNHNPYFELTPSSPDESHLGAHSRGGLAISKPQPDFSGVSQDSGSPSPLLQPSLHHHRSSSYPAGSKNLSDEETPVLTSLKSTRWFDTNDIRPLDHPALDSPSYVNFINNYCFV